MGKIKYRAVEEMKDSGVKWLGEIPKEWNIRPLNTVFIENKKQNKRGLESNVLSLSYGNIIQRDVENNFGLLPASFNTYQIVKEQDLVFRLTDLQNDKKSLRVGLVKEKGIITSAYLGLINNEDKSNQFFYFLFHTYDLMKVYYNMGGGLRQTMAFEDMKKLPTIIPTKYDQQKIANFLDIKTKQFDSIISRKIQLIQKLEEAKKSLISEVVTGKVKIVDGEMVKRQSREMKYSGVEWLGMIPMEWEVKKIKFISSKIGSGKTPKGGSEIYQDEGIIFLRSQNVYDSGLRLEDVVYIDKKIDKTMINTRVKYEDVLLNITGASIGRCSIYLNKIYPANVNQHVCIIRFDDKVAMKKLCLYILQSELVQRQIMSYQTGASREGLNFDEIKNISINLPKNRAEQLEIERFLSVKIKLIYNMIVKNELQIQKLKQAKQSMISEAVTGRIDLREWQII